MPNVYAHYKLGWEVFPRLSPALRSLLETHRALYQAGFYGPDIFFYYRPVFKTTVRQLGNILHQQSAAKFFIQVKAALYQLPDRKAGEAYLLGYVSHFVLDSCCHSYVEYMVEREDMNHAAMESDLERELLVRDGRDPVRYHTASHFRAITSREAEVIAAVHGEVAPMAAMETVHSTREFSRFLLPTTPTKRWMLEEVLRLSGRYE